MSKLNTQWMASVLAQVIANTAQGVPTFVGEHPEIMALKEAGFIKIDKRKKGEEEGTFASVATETATMDAFHAAFPADAAQAPQVAPQLAEVDTAAQVAADQAAQLAATAQPQFTDAPAPAPAPAPVAQAVPDVAAGDLVIGGGTPAAVVDTVERGGTSFAIEVGIPFVKIKQRPPAARQTTERAEKYPFSVLAQLKYDNMHSDSPNPDFVPSFHVAGVQTKNFSGNVKRANDGSEKVQGYEATHGVTFRATAAGANDP